MEKRRRTVAPKKMESSDNNGLTVIDHLEELRSRLVRVLVYSLIFSAIVWSAYDFFFNLLAYPVIGAMKKSATNFLITGVAEGFSIKLQISAIFGIIMAFPLIMAELWSFISPALKPKERKWALIVAPFSILLFISGVLLAYMILPVGIEWLISQNPPQSQFMPSLSETLLFVAKMELAFGIMFQMPILIVFLANAGLIKSWMLRKFWREAIVLICIVVAVITPTADAFTMIMMSLPMILLYFGTVEIVRVIEKKLDNRKIYPYENS